MLPGTPWAAWPDAMCQELKLLPAGIQDAERVAPWIYDTLGSGNALFGSTEKSICIQRIRDLFRIGGHRFSWDACRILCHQDLPIGYCIAYSHKERTHRDWPFLRSVLKAAGWPAVLGMLGTPGFLTLKESRPGEFYISALGIDPLARGQGYGRALLGQVMAQAALQGNTRFSLMVDERNTPALRLYQSLGFQTVRQTRIHPVRLLHMYKSL